MTWRTSTRCKKSRAGSGSLCEPRKPRKTVAPTTDWCCFFPLVEQWNMAGCLHPRLLQRTETCVILSYLFFFSPLLRTGNHCGSQSTAVEAPEQSRAVGGRLCKSRNTVVRTFLRVQCCSLWLPWFFRCKQAIRLRLLCGSGDIACNGFRGAPEE